MMVRRSLAGARIALVVSLLWVATIVVLRAGMGFSFGDLSIAEFTGWFSRNVVGLFVSGFILGALFATGLVLTRHPDGEPRLTRRNAIGVGALGGLLLAMFLIAYYAYAPFSNLFGEVIIPMLTIGTFGAVTGYGMWRTTHHAELAAGEPPAELLER